MRDLPGDVLDFSEIVHALVSFASALPRSKMGRTTVSALAYAFVLAGHGRGLTLASVEVR